MSDDTTRTAYGLTFTLTDGNRAGPTLTVRSHDDTVLDRAGVDDDVSFDELIEAWIRSQALQDGAATCRCCGTELRRVGLWAGRTQYEDALEVRFVGGYGQFFDNFLDGPLVAFLCGTCAARLCEAEPWIVDLIDHR